MVASSQVGLLDCSIRADRPSGKGEATPEIVVIPSFHTASAESRHLPQFTSKESPGRESS
jgi:hypothetical protein